jgi:hypothetical protein
MAWCIGWCLTTWKCYPDANVFFFLHEAKVYNFSLLVMPISFLRYLSKYSFHIDKFLSIK